jgi:hypothetical protein
MDSYVVICRDDMDLDGNKGHYILATRQVFADPRVANEYARGLPPAREAMVIPGGWDDLRPAGV